MSTLSRPVYLFVLLLATCILPTRAQTTSVDLPVIGRVSPRSASEIQSSNWSVGAETMDRDFTDFRSWKDYLGPLGIKKARIQAGWAKTEKNRGKYDWTWLDEIVEGISRQGVKPWINVSYGNPLYAGGGGTNLGAAIPTTEEAVQAWDRWLRAMVVRYRDHVEEWEIWNEPNGKNPASVYADLLIRSARVIRSEQPEAKIIGMAVAGVDVPFVDSVLTILKNRNELSTIDIVSYHPYLHNPDASYPAVERLRRTVVRYDTRITLLQGENGAPSEWRRTKALSKYNWTELSQAKWALRRLLGDLGRGIPSSIFAISDMKYPDEINRKGLLFIDDTRRVLYPKPAYYAVQHLAALFDSSLVRIEDFTYTSTDTTTLSVFAYRNIQSGQHAVTIWRSDEIPSDSQVRTLVDFTFSATSFTDPVYVDLRTGIVYELPSGRWNSTGSTYMFRSIPVYDSPVLIIERSLVPMANPARN